MENKQNEMTADVLDISKVKDIYKLKIKPNQVIIKVSGAEDNRILVNDPSIRRNNVTWKVFKVGENVKDVNEGDIVVDMMFGGANFVTKDEEKYIICDRYNLFILAEPDNYNE